MSEIITRPARGPIYKDNYEKGRAFEDYVIGLFNKRRFKLKNYRPAKKFDGKISLDYFYPDVEMELVFARNKYRFAVECKWREEFKNGIITWAKESQICTYRMFQDQTRIPVFIAIGVGGLPSNPEKLFVTP